MDQSSSDRLVVRGIDRLSDGFILTLEDADGDAQFALRLEDVDGIALLVGTESLSKWLAKNGQLWALSPIHSLIKDAVQNTIIEVPIVLTAARLPNTAKDHP
jgi:hypothetical protein